MNKFIFVCLLFIQTSLSAFSDIAVAEQVYTIISQIGDGDKAVVYHVKDQNGKAFALKKMHRRDLFVDHYPREVVEYMFAANGYSLIAANEYAISQQIDHSNIMKVYDLFFLQDSEGVLDTYLLMELVEGKTLRMTELKSHATSIAIANAVNFLEALKYCFNKGFINIDLHETNIMFDQNLQLKLIDIDSFSEIALEDSDFKEDYLESVRSSALSVLLRGDFSDETLWELRDLVNTIDLQLEVYDYLEMMQKYILALDQSVN